MNNTVQQLSQSARVAAQRKNWPEVKARARDILNRQRDSAEGYFLLGLAESAAHRYEQAVRAFSRVLAVDNRRYDAAVELASEYMRTNECGTAVKLLQKHQMNMNESPRYLDMAATIYTDAGLPEMGWPLYQRANELQPGVESLLARFAACSVYIGKIRQAQQIYSELLERAPDHQRNHYELSRLATAKDTTHIEQMQAVVSSKNSRPEKNIYAYYALGKEHEDLERWDEAFEYFKMAGDAALSVADYDVESDVRLIDKIVEVCSKDWMADRSNEMSAEEDKTPIFVVGLPRTGTTLVERILSSHTGVESVGESFFMQGTIKQVSGIRTNESMSAAIIAAASKKDVKRIAKGYLQAIEYKFGTKPIFVEKFPENFLYLGFIAKAFPNARIVCLKRNPMDTCFALYKQSFFRYAYSLHDLASYYAAYHRLCAHWRIVLQDRLIEIDYEALVSDQEAQTRALLRKAGLEFEDACLNFENNESASNTASTVQIRKKMHNRSVDRWRHFETQLEPLKIQLESANIKVQ